MNDCNFILKVVAQDDTEGLSHDGIDEIIRRLNIYDLINCVDSNGNTPLLEAAG